MSEWKEKMEGGSEEVRAIVGGKGETVVKRENGGEEERKELN